MAILIGLCGGIISLLMMVLSLNVFWLALLTVAACVGVWRNAKKPFEKVDPKLRFLVLIPAHDEGQIVGSVLKKIRETLDWPESLYELVLIADNCTDNTAEEAKPYATVLVRNDPSLRGKGAALAWAAKKLTSWERPFDAVVIIDADTRVNPSFFAGFQTILDSGDFPLVQAVNLVGNPEEGWRPALTYTGFAAINFIRPSGRDTLGCSAGLMGTGMCYRSDFYLNRTYASDGLAEDLEEGMRYRLEGIRTRFAYGSEVRSDMPVEGKNAESQRMRWEGGRKSVVKAWRLKMIKAWFKSPNRIVFDGIMELNIPPLGQLGAAILGLGLLSAVFRFWCLAGWSVFLMGLIFLHLIFGLLLTKAPISVYRRLLFAPVYVIWKLSLRIIRRKNSNDQWVRTNREMKS